MALCNILEQRSSLEELRLTPLCHNTLEEAWCSVLEEEVGGLGGDFGRWDKMLGTSMQSYNV